MTQILVEKLIFAEGEKPLESDGPIAAHVRAQGAVATAPTYELMNRWVDGWMDGCMHVT